MKTQIAVYEIALKIYRKSSSDFANSIKQELENKINQLKFKIALQSNQ